RPPPASRAAWSPPRPARRARRSARPSRRRQHSAGPLWLDRASNPIQPGNLLGTDLVDEVERGLGGAPEPRLAGFSRPAAVPRGPPTARDRGRNRLRATRPEPGPAGPDRSAGRTRAGSPAAR